MKSTLGKNPGSEREWLLVDAADQPLGRLAAEVADVLRGKDKPTYTPHIDMGAFVIVVNAEKVKLTGRKDAQKEYQQYSGFRSGLKKTTAAVMRARHPDRMIRQAVAGMLPKNNLSRRAVRRLKIYAGDQHPHEAQNPRAVTLL
jgi:large subunit ribosomal protein L13